jgi:hypothetical protein
LSDVAWPMGMDRDLGTRPLVFNPKVILVAILDNSEACERARTALIDAGFVAEDLRVYTSQEILADHEVYLMARSTTRRVVGTLTDDQATIDLYFGYAREGRAALWVHVPEKHDASRAIRYLTDHHVLHYRYFSSTREDDIHVRHGNA